MSFQNVFGGPIEAPGITPAPATGTGNAEDLTLTAGAAGTGNADGGNVNLVPTVGTGTGTDGEVQINSSTEGFVIVQIPYLATSIDTGWFVAARAYRVKSIILRPLTVAAATATVQIFKGPSGVAINGLGSVALAAAQDLATGDGVVANTNYAAALVSNVAGALDIAAGDAIGPAFTGTMTTKVGVITVTLVPI
jgi:hypothetical protein